MKLAVLFSGGKDSHLAMYKASLDHEIACAITVKSTNRFSYMFQSLGFEYTSMQLFAQGVEQHVVETSGEKEEELVDLEKGIEETIEKFGVEGVVTGAIESIYQASRIQKICAKLNLWCFNPLWQMDKKKMLQELEENFQGVILGVFAYPLDESFVGVEMGNSLYTKLQDYEERYQISAIGEGGEFESFISNGPMYKYPLNIQISSLKKDSENCVYVEKFNVFE